MVNEPCIDCAEDTAVGTVLYSDRRAIEGLHGLPAFRCALCQARLRPPRPDRRMSEREVRNLVKNGSAAGLTWGGRPGG